MATEQDKFDALCDEYREVLIKQLAFAAMTAQTENVGRNWLKASLNEALLEFARLMDERTAALAKARSDFMAALANLVLDVSKVTESAEYPGILRELAKAGITKEHVEFLLNDDAVPAKVDWAKRLEEIQALMNTNDQATIAPGDVLEADTIE